MILCLDVGNSHLYGGIFLDETILLRFRSSSKATTSDEIGIFLRAVLRENGIEPNKIQHIAICSVVPQLDYSLRSACKKYFNLEPFMLQAGVKTGLKIKCPNPLEIGSDRIANAIAAIKRYPEQNSIIVDFGTATTFCAITAKHEYLGGAILPGMRLSMEVLQSKTAKLPSVEIIKPERAIGRTTEHNIQAGLYYGCLGATREFLQRIRMEAFAEEQVNMIATGGFAYLFEEEALFDEVVPDLVLQGLYQAILIN